MYTCIQRLIYTHWIWGGNREQNFLYQICVLDYEKNLLRFSIAKIDIMAIKNALLAFGGDHNFDNQNAVFGNR